MSARTAEQLAEDEAATVLAQGLIKAVVNMAAPPHVVVNALAGALGAYVAMASHDEAQAKQLMRLMATQAREQMELQFRLRALSHTVGSA
jgi:hypothetical protein